jgi:peptidoglycan/xylan/chitin deacetylase (PgdA/CDA1 family)
MPQCNPMLTIGRWLRSIGRGQRALILLYHRVVESRSDPLFLCVQPKNFAEHLAILKEHCTIVRLSELPTILCKHQRQGKPCVALTFDDGYADNLVNAKRLIEEADVTGTVFAVAGRSGSDIPVFWWDRLEQLVLSPNEIPHHIECEIAGQRMHWEPDGQPSDLVRDETWNIMRTDRHRFRYRVYLDIYEAIRRCPHSERMNVLETVAEQISSVPKLPSLQRLLSQNEIKRLNEGGSIEVGAHSMTHPILALLTMDEQRNEIRQSRRFLMETTGAAVSTFSYPYGGRGDFSEDTEKIVRDEGFACACANWEGVVSRRTNAFCLPRFIVRDWDAPVFERMLLGWVRS